MHRRIDALGQLDAEPAGFCTRQLPQPFTVGMGHVRKARSEAFVVRAHERIGSLQVQMIPDQHQCSLPVVGPDAAGRVGQHQHPNAQQPQYAHRKHHLLQRVSLVVMDTTLQNRDGNSLELSYDKLAAMSYHSGPRKMRDAGVGKPHSLAKLFGKIPQPRTEHDRQTGNPSDAARNPLRGLPGAFIVALRGARHCKKIPTIEADSRFAIVPASMARTPSRASSSFLLGASAPMPPIWMPMELKFAKPQSAKVAMVNDRGSSEPLSAPSREKATSSFRTIRTPSRLPIVGQSRQGTPTSQATGASTQPNNCSRLAGTSSWPAAINQPCRSSHPCSAPSNPSTR